MVLTGLGNCGEGERHTHNTFPTESHAEMTIFVELIHTFITAGEKVGEAKTGGGATAAVM